MPEAFSRRRRLLNGLFYFPSTFPYATDAAPAGQSQFQVVLSSHLALANLFNIIRQITNLVPHCRILSLTVLYY